MKFLNLKLLKEGQVIAEEDGVLLVEAYRRGRKVVELKQRDSSGIISKGIQKAVGLAKNHPFIMGALAAGAATHFRKKKRKEVYFYANDLQEKKTYDDIIKTLLATGKYRKEKQTVKAGTYIWILKRID
jgi:hypothetical protein